MTLFYRYYLVEYYTDSKNKGLRFGVIDKRKYTKAIIEPEIEFLHKQKI